MLLRKEKYHKDLTNGLVQCLLQVHEPLFHVLTETYKAPFNIPHIKFSIVLLI